VKMTSCVFLCGDRSPYGVAHLEPIVRCFDLRAIVIADTKRWKTFREALSGGERHEYSQRESGIRSAAKRIAGMPRTIYRERRHQRRLGAPGVQLIQVNDANASDVKSRLRAFSPDILLSAAYPQILDGELLEIAPLKAVNFHPSLLPRCRGAHPHYWCLATGEDTGGVTAHFMTKRIDRGDIIAQRSIDLRCLYYADLYKRIVDETPHLVEDVARFLADPKAQATPQDESRESYFKNDRDVDRRLDFNQLNASELWNRIRAGRAHTTLRGHRIDVERAHIPDAGAASSDRLPLPGTIVGIAGEGVAVATMKSAPGQHILIIESIRSGRRIIPFARWTESYGMGIGDKLG
jgi:methionyl-tRNA formyltransferase